MATVFLTIGAFAVVMGVMAVGVIVKGRCLRGSCGGAGREGCGTCGRMMK